MRQDYYVAARLAFYFYGALLSIHCFFNM